MASLVRLIHSVRAAVVARANALPVLLFVFTWASSASAAPRYVDRPLTLPRLVFGGDVGIGVAHSRAGGLNLTGAGLNLEGALGITSSVELGLRTGIRLGDDARFLKADQVGRTLATETYGTGFETVANPELRVRWGAYRGRVVEVGLDGRLYLPIETATRAGILFGVPLAFHVADFLRIDTGLYLPVIFTSPASTVISVPAYFWFQASNKVWLGPMVGLRHVDPGGPVSSRDDLLLGFGLGWQVASSVDLKWMLLAPRVNVNSNESFVFGGGFGVQFRIGE